MHGVAPSQGPSSMMHKSPSVEGVRDMQAANQAMMQKLGEKLQQGEISKPTYDKVIDFLQNANAKLDAYLAGGAAPAGGTAPVSSPSSGSQPGAQGHSTQDTFEAAPTSKKPVDLNPSSGSPVITPKELQGMASGAPPATPEILDNPGGGSKPGIINTSGAL